MKRSGTWTDYKGRIHLIRHMATDYIMNVIKYLERQEPKCTCSYYEDPPCICGADIVQDMIDDKIDELEKELAYRAILPAEA